MDKHLYFQVEVLSLTLIFGQFQIVVFQTTQTASGLSAAGVYSVTVTDNNGCNINDNVNVSNAPNLILTDSVIQPLCYNDTNGSDLCKYVWRNTSLHLQLGKKWISIQ